MEMHPYYTEIPRRSFEVIVRNGWLTEVLLALITDPTDPYEIADTLVRGSGTNLVIFPETDGDDPYPAPIMVPEIAGLGSSALARMKISVSQWISQSSTSALAMNQLVEWDRHIGAWCAANVAASVRHLSPRERTGSDECIAATMAWASARNPEFNLRAIAKARETAEYDMERMFRGIGAAPIGAGDPAEPAMYSAIRAASICDARRSESVETVARLSLSEARTALIYARQFDDAGSDAHIRSIMADAAMWYPI